MNYPTDMKTARRITLPLVGQSVIATRVKPSDILCNRVIGPVVQIVHPSHVVVRCNEGTDLDTSFELKYSEWRFEILC